MITIFTYRHVDSGLNFSFLLSKVFEYSIDKLIYLVLKG